MRGVGLIGSHYALVALENLDLEKDMHPTRQIVPHEVGVVFLHLGEDLLLLDLGE